jgi:hypothetical protein
MTPEEIKRYEFICRYNAPFPLNYLPSGNERDRVLGLVIGMMIEKGWLKR